MHRMRLPFVLLTLVVLAVLPASAGAADRWAEGLPGFDLSAATIPDLQQRMDRGQLTSVRLTAAYLHRIEAVDGKVHSVVAVNRRALAEAAASDARRRAGRTLGPLDGIPVLLKDNIDTRDQPTTAGSRVFAGTRPAEDAHLVTRPHRAGAVIGVWRLSGVDADVDRVVNASVAVLRARGATVVDVELPYQDEVSENEFPALLTEFRRDLNAYLGARPGALDTLAEVIAFNRADPVELSKFGQELFEQAEAAPPPTDPVYLERRRTATDAARRSIDETLARFDLDAIMAPTNSPAWRTDYATGDAFVLGSSSPAAVAGYPNVSVPAGHAGPLPIGVSFFAERWSDAKVLALAGAFELAHPTYRPPGFIPTIG